ncbi:transmembrane protein 255B-like [Engraulis encrasicolus]|uniref:transmembrane protein 255B-like n=1 Tax=Engraulis encrasicolus TaxID=184585 RepID=UPI002FD743A8
MNKLLSCDLCTETLRRRVLCLVLGMLLLSLVIVATGTYASRATDSLSTTGCPSGFIFVFGSVLSLLGLYLRGNRLLLFRAAILFFSIGIIVSSICLVLDGFFILPNIDVRPIRAGRCQFYSTGLSFMYENHYATVPCQGLKESCLMVVRSGTCYCCDLYDCGNGGYLDKHYEFVGVQGCTEVLFVYGFLWLVTGLNLLALVLGLLCSAMLGNINAMDGNHRTDSTREDIPLPAAFPNATAPPLLTHVNDSSPLLTAQHPIYHQQSAQAPQTLYPSIPSYMTNMGSAAFSDGALCATLYPGCPSSVINTKKLDRGL